MESIPRSKTSTNTVERKNNSAGPRWPGEVAAVPRFSADRADANIARDLINFRFSAGALGTGAPVLTNPKGLG